MTRGGGRVRMRERCNTLLKAWSVKGSCTLRAGGVGVAFAEYCDGREKAENR